MKTSPFPDQVREANSSPTWNLLKTLATGGWLHMCRPAGERTDIDVSVDKLTVTDRTVTVIRSRSVVRNPQILKFPSNATQRMKKEGGLKVQRYPQVVEKHEGTPSRFHDVASKSSQYRTEPCFEPQIYYLMK